MKGKITKEDKFNSIPNLLDRRNPIVITEISNPANLSYFQNAIKKLRQYFLLEMIESPLHLFNFIKEHQNDLIIIVDDIFARRKNYLDIVQGAVCSSPDSGELWSVNYLDEKPFVFKGELILCTIKTKEEINANKKLSYFARDCHFI
ncbi:MAG: hypothetical protein IPP32_16420 [Bacteroidetes bacterium]|nr:hypothetical protein [Bacteroidota bacterium]